MKNTKNSPWVKTSEATAYLNVCRQTLSKNLKRLNYGYHYFRKDPANRSSAILWHLERLEKFFCTPITPRTKK